MRVKKFWKVFLSGLIVILFIVSVAYWFVPVQQSTTIDFPAEVVQISDVFFGNENDPIGISTFRLRESTGQGQYDIKKHIEDTKASLWRIYYQSDEYEIIMVPFDQSDILILDRITGKYIEVKYASVVKKVKFEKGQIKITFRRAIGQGIAINFISLICMWFCFWIMDSMGEDEKKKTC
jgi:hypothetical protein